MKRKRYVSISILLLVILFILTIAIFHWNCDSVDVEEGQQLVIYSSHPVEFMKPILEEFEAQTQIQTTIICGGSGELLNQLEQEATDADILWGGSLSTLKPQKYLFETYQSVNESEIQEEFQNTEGMLTRFSDVPSILIVNNDLVGNLVIESYEDLLNPELKGKIAFCSPSVSSSAYEHLINMLYAAGEGDPEAGWDYVEAFCDNLDGNLLNSSKEVYQGVEDGEYVVGLTFEEAAAAMVAEGENIGIIYMEEGVVSTPDCVCILKNAKHMENAKRFVDFVTGYGAQNLLSKQLHRRSVRNDVEVPEYLKQKAEFTQIFVDRELVDQMKQAWIMKFREIFYLEEEYNEE